MTDGSPALPRPARPQRPRPDFYRRGEQRVERFLEAATEVFLEKGYRDARLTDVVARSGGSLSTLYSAYGDKQGLALAIMDRSIAAFGASLDLLDGSQLPPPQALPEAAERMVAETLSPGRIVTHRIVIAEGLNFPELRDWFMEHGVAPAERRLSAWFERERVAGRLVLEHASVAANRFYMMVFGGVILRSVNGQIGAADLPRIQQEAREAVSIFLEGVLPRA
ncbi:TetR/AcrR family transcriptional regulator [Pseudoxanthomonas indica]|uniref:Transcriptional regulator, TetR family n=1 Tax=Pseudoxanthomonas indica TaxID=428993 RepID=A0A1T5IWB7_9GAMM|nr:TetR/AcrR family transcriptional regulator [Pseudoxanthomonas indica]GGD54754.1 TetR family transcriptional regulator [Pseudoxanthomonas indica]SKC43414.1 transcriptional regulator, TetR family [Pseudoxanthomonas indica]